MSGLLRRGLPAMWKVNPLWAFFSVALISLGTLVVACRQVAVGGGRWKGGGMDGGMKAAMNTGPPRPKDWVVQDSLQLATESEHLNSQAGYASVPPAPAKNYHTDSAWTKISSSPVPFITHPNPCQAPSPRPFDGVPRLTDRQRAGMASREDLRRGELVEWLLRDDSGSQWRGYSCCIVPQNLPSTASTPTQTILPPLPPATWLQSFLSSRFTACQSNNPDRLLLGLLPRNEGHDR